MKLTYSATVNQWFDGYPRVLRITCGPSIVELGGPWVDGSVIELFQTPLSKTHIGQYIEGAILPEYKIRYSNNGLETGWTIFLKVSGYGYFFTKNTEEERDIYYWLNLEKTFEVISSFNDKHLVFRKSEMLSTSILYFDWDNQIVNPITPPVTPPVTPPITPPGEYYQFPPGYSFHESLADHLVLVTSYQTGIGYTVPSTLSVTVVDMSIVGYSYADFSEHVTVEYVGTFGYLNGCRVRLFKDWLTASILVVLARDIYLTEAFTVEYMWKWTNLTYNGVNILPVILGIR